MEESKRENFEFLNVINNPTIIQSLSMSEDHQFSAAAFPPATLVPGGNQFHGFPENHPRLPGINPYYTYQNPSVHVNPSFTDVLYDLPLEREFSRLNLSSARHLSAVTAEPPRASVGGSIIRDDSFDLSPVMGFSYENQQNSSLNGNLQRLRAQSAASGHMGLFMQSRNHRAVENHENLNAFSVSGNMNPNTLYDYDLNFTYNFRKSLTESVGRNGFRLPNGLEYENQLNFEYRRASMNGVALYNSLASLYTNSVNRQRLSLDNLRGNMLNLAKNQHGCRLLQKKFDQGIIQEEIDMIFSEVKDHACELMMDQFGNYLMQKLLEVCNEEQMNQLLLLVINDHMNLLAICLDNHGTRVMQKFIEQLTTPEQRFIVMSVLIPIIVPLTNRRNGHHVIQRCLKLFSTEENKHILNVVADNCLEIGTDQSGCCILKQCILHAQGESRDRLLAEITANALLLSEHPFGNYVVQYVLSLKMPRVTEDILAQLAGNYVSLSMNKHGSNVVERCLELSEGGDQAIKIIKEIIYSPKFLMVLQDPYGNYVAQSALQYSKGGVRNAMVELIIVHYEFLHSHPHGKRVLAHIKGSKMLRV